MKEFLKMLQPQGGTSILKKDRLWSPTSKEQNPNNGKSTIRRTKTFIGRGIRRKRRAFAVFHTCKFSQKIWRLRKSAGEFQLNKLKS